MAELITIQALQDASVDAKSLEEVVNGDDAKQVTTRLGETYPSVKKAVKTLFENGGLPATPFATKALMTASALIDGDYAMVTDDTVNNGLYVKTAGAWVKSSYDPLAKTAVDYAYVGGNLIGAKTKTVANRGLNASGNYSPTPDADYASGILAVNKGDVLYILNSIESYITGNGHGAVFYTDDPSLNSAAIKVSDTRQTLTDATTTKKYLKVTVPDTAKYLVFNTKFGATLIDWAIHKDAFSDSYVAGKEVFKGINGAFIEVDESFNATKNELLQGNSLQGDLYISEGKIPVAYITTNGVLDAGQATWEAFKFLVDEGGTYFIKVTSNITHTYFYLFYSTSYLASTTETVRGKAALIPTSQADIYKFTVPTGQDIKAVFMNTSLGDLDIRTTLSIQKNSFDDSKIGVSTSAIKSINGNALIDTYAREQISLKSNGSRLQGKKVWALGDSITEGTMGGYVKYLTDVFGTEVKNLGSSGARANRVADIVMGGAGFPRRDSGTASYTWLEQDFMNLASVTLMIGTNDSNYNTWGSVDTLPTGTLADYTTPAEYWALFPNDYIGNIALVIEYIKSKSPKCEIHLVTPIQGGVEDNRPNYGIVTARTHMIEVAKKYSAHLIDAQNESGLYPKSMRGELNIYSYDGTHLNEQGNEVFGKFLAQKVLSFG